MMGDSFTQGFSADIGKSFVETLEAAIARLRYRMEYSDSGQRNESGDIAMLQVAASIVWHSRRQVGKVATSTVDSGFYMNDFRNDNLDNQG